MTRRALTPLWAYIRPCLVPFKLDVEGEVEVWGEVYVVAFYFGIEVEIRVCARARRSCIASGGCFFLLALKGQMFALCPSTICTGSTEPPEQG